MIFVYLMAALIAGILLAAVFMPKTYNVERSIVINKNIPAIMDKVGDLNAYAAWNPWQQADPSSKKTITGDPGKPGHKYAWEGRKVGMGSLTLLDKGDKHIHFDLEFFKPWKSKAKDNWLFESRGDEETTVTWQNSGELPWPMARLMGPAINKNLAHQFGVGLNNLKKMVEA